MNKNTLIPIAIFFITGFIMGAMLRGCNGSGKVQTGIIRTDTVIRFVPRTDTLYQTVQATHYIPYTVTGHDTIYQKLTEHISGHDTTWLTQYIHQSDTASYRDTLRVNDQFKAEIFDTLTSNRIIGREVRWANLSPIEVKTVTNTMMKKGVPFKLFAGIDGRIPVSNMLMNRFDASVQLGGLINDRYLIDARYSPFSSTIDLGFQVKISFRKQ